MIRTFISISLFVCIVLCSCSMDRENKHVVQDQDTISPLISNAVSELSLASNSRKDFADMFKADSSALKELPDGVYVPSFFSYEGQESFFENLYSLDLYKYEDVSFFYCGIMGNAGCFDDEFPDNGIYLSKECRIDAITYYSKRGIFSGFMDDGRIFYLKKRIWKDDVPHPTFWGIIYPQKYAEVVSPIIKKISNWHPAFTWDDKESYSLRHLPE